MCCCLSVQVFDDVAIELTMAILQYFQTKPAEEHLFRTMKALSKFVTVRFAINCAHINQINRDINNLMYSLVQCGAGVAGHPAAGADDRTASEHLQGRQRAHRRADRADLEEGALNREADACGNTEQITSDYKHTPHNTLTPARHL